MSQGEAAMLVNQLWYLFFFGTGVLVGTAIVKGIASGISGGLR